jgi:hypothetical protein
MADYKVVITQLGSGSKMTEIVSHIYGWPFWSIKLWFYCVFLWYFVFLGFGGFLNLF